MGCFLGQEILGKGCLSMCRHAFCRGPSKISSVSVLMHSSSSGPKSSRMMLNYSFGVSGTFSAIVPAVGKIIFLSAHTVFSAVELCFCCIGELTSLVVGVSSGSDGIMPFLSQMTSLMGSSLNITTW